MILKNKDLKNKVSTILNHYTVKNYEKLIQDANSLLKKNPNIDILWNILGLTYQQKGEFEKAETNFYKCLQVNPKNISAINNLGNNYKYLFNYTKAEEYFNKAIEQNSKYLNALVNYGNLKFELNQFTDALKLLHRALVIDEKSISVRVNLALVYQSTGEYKKAINFLKEINVLNPKIVRADKMMSALINYNENDEHLVKMEKKLKELALDDNQKIFLYFALGKAYEDKQNFSKATEHIEIGNHLKMTSSSYNIDRERKLFKNIKNLFSDYSFDNKSTIKSNKNIIFILGMPRSGTTLVEQIISSHPDVYGAGELNFLSRIIYKKFLKEDKINFIDNFKKLNNTELSLISNQYLNFVNSFNSNKVYITDKALFNFQWIGFIKILFPNAKIINCTRDPKDNCLSIYKNLFENEGHWCYDKKMLVDCYNLYTDLMVFWHEKIPGEIYDIKYEDLITNPEAKIKELVSASGLNWNEKCLKYNENKNAIKTLSVNQARKRIYSSSVSLYKKYEPFLKEFSEHFK
jgi:tetratricopeptide (TPR) repeat protein